MRHGNLPKPETNKTRSLMHWIYYLYIIGFTAIVYLFFAALALKKRAPLSSNITLAAWWQSLRLNIRPALKHGLIPASIAFGVCVIIAIIGAVTGHLETLGASSIPAGVTHSLLTTFVGVGAGLLVACAIVVSCAFLVRKMRKNKQTTKPQGAAQPSAATPGTGQQAQKLTVAGMMKKYARTAGFVVVPAVVCVAATYIVHRYFPSRWTVWRQDPFIFWVSLVAIGGLALALYKKIPWAKVFANPANALLSTAIGTLFIITIGAVLNIPVRQTLEITWGWVLCIFLVALGTSMLDNQKIQRRAKLAIGLLVFLAYAVNLSPVWLAAHKKAEAAKALPPAKRTWVISEPPWDPHTGLVVGGPDRHYQVTVVKWTDNYISFRIPHNQEDATLGSTYFTWDQTSNPTNGLWWQASPPGQGSWEMGKVADNFYTGRLYDGHIVNGQKQYIPFQMLAQP